MTTAWDKGENYIFTSNFLVVLLQVVMDASAECHLCAQMQVTRWWCLLKCRGFTYQDQASTGPTELIGKSAASCMPWVRPVLVNPITQKSFANNNTKLAAQGQHEANGGRRLYFIAFLKTSSCLLLSASILFLSAQNLSVHSFCIPPRLFLCCHLSIFSCPTLSFCCLF